MKSRIVTITLATGLALLLVLLADRLSGVHLPGNWQGYEPVQPIAYSHRLHAGELKIAVPVLPLWLRNEPPCGRSAGQCLHELPQFHHGVARSSAR